MFFPQLTPPLPTAGLLSLAQNNSDRSCLARWNIYLRPAYWRRMSLCDLLSQCGLMDGGALKCLWCMWRVSKNRSNFHLCKPWFIIHNCHNSSPMTIMWIAWIKGMADDQRESLNPWKLHSSALSHQKKKGGEFSTHHLQKKNQKRKHKQNQARVLLLFSRFKAWAPHSHTSVRFIFVDVVTDYRYEKINGEQLKWISKYSDDNTHVTATRRQIRHHKSVTQTVCDAGERWITSVMG